MKTAYVTLLQLSAVTVTTDALYNTQGTITICGFMLKTDPIKEKNTCHNLRFMNSMTPQTFPLKQTPFIAVVVPEGATDFRIDLKLAHGLFYSYGEGVARARHLIDLPPGPWSIVIPSVRKASEDEARMVVEQCPYYAKCWTNYTNKADGEPPYIRTPEWTCDNEIDSLHSLMIASMPEGMLWVNPYGEKEPYPSQFRDVDGYFTEEQNKDYISSRNKWHSAQSKVVGDTVILKQG